MSNMKVCVVGHFQDDLDEGVRIVGKEIAKHLKDADIEVRTCNLHLSEMWQELKNFQPDIVHFVISPTFLGLFATKIIGLCYFKAKIVVSAIHPAINETAVLKMLKPDLILVQSEQSETLFSSAGFKTHFLPNGVDTNRFRPLGRKDELRDKYGVPKDKFVILHLASLKKERNLGVFCDIQRISDYHVIIVGREKEGPDQEVIDELKRAGCDLRIHHFAQIEEIYNLVDCYVFPTKEKKACIETPLSVLEALACGIPVVSTKFGALPRLLENNCEGISFIADEEDYFYCLDQIKNSEISPQSKMATSYSWNHIISDLISVYSNLIKTK